MKDDPGQPPEESSAASVAEPSRPAAAPSIDVFLGEPSRDISHWEWLWAGDHRFPAQGSHGGLFGRFLRFGKRLLRPFVKTPVNDLWERQRVFNLILLELLETRRAKTEQTLAGHTETLAELDRRTRDGLAEVMAHNDALFALVDQKLDRYRRESQQLWHRLGAFIAASEAAPPKPLVEVQRQQGYLDLEARYRGSEEEIAGRLAAYLPYLEGRGEILDLGCGRGESLAVFTAHGLEARGIDASAEMVARCRDKGLRAEEADLFEHLQSLEPGSLGAVVSYHVIEHLPATAVERLVRLAWRALKPGGALILETPSPLSLTMASRNFWIDPTHIRPVHPASLEISFRGAGFEPVHRLDLHPFPDDQRLPEIDLQKLPQAQRPLADEVNRLRDMLDDLLFGYRDFAMVGEKP